MENNPHQRWTTLASRGGHTGTLGIGLSVVVVVGEVRKGQFFSLIEAYISNLSLLLSLEPSEKFVVVGGGG